MKKTTCLRSYNERVIFIIIPVLLITITVMVYSSFGYGRGDHSLTGKIRPASLMTRGIEIELLNAFQILSRNYYDQMTISGYDDLFDSSILHSYSHQSVSLDSQIYCEESLESFLLKQAKAHVLYSPFAFSPNKYVLLQKGPMVTEPMFAREYPVIILMLPVSDPYDQIVHVIDCGMRVFFVPSFLLKITNL